jgi:hypothetical protein
MQIQSLHKEGSVDVETRSMGIGGQGEAFRGIP